MVKDKWFGFTANLTLGMTVSVCSFFRFNPG